MSVERVFSAIGDPTRREIVEMLSRSDATVNELAAPFSMTLQAVAKHIRILEGAGVIRKKKIGRSHHCSLDRGALSQARSWIDDLERDWSARLDRLGAFLDETADVPKDTSKDTDARTPPTLSGATPGGRTGASPKVNARNGQKKKRPN
jgi:DNA-binding transcriptional ArsR family regulator